MTSEIQKQTSIFSSSSSFPVDFDPTPPTSSWSTVDSIVLSASDSSRILLVIMQLFSTIFLGVKFFRLRFEDTFSQFCCEISPIFCGGVTRFLTSHFLACDINALVQLFPSSEVVAVEPLGNAI